MMVKLVNKRDDYAEIVFSDVDISIVDALTDYLNNIDGVEYAGYRLEHPLTGEITLIIKTKPDKIKTKTAIDNALNSLRETLSKLEEAVAAF